MGGGRGGNSSKLSKLSSGGDGGGAGISRSKCAATHKVNKLTKLTKCKSTVVISSVFEGDVGDFFLFNFFWKLTTVGWAPAFQFW